ncbi:hypothetical protein BDZ97DRAFT_1787083 [Flammula alnicola]|nr:hypothetical protein BDZ97DRAFT_1787083 [Flammula alnicola]
MRSLYRLRVSAPISIAGTLYLSCEGRIFVRRVIHVVVGVFLVSVAVAVAVVIVVLNQSEIDRCTALNTVGLKVDNVVIYNRSLGSIGGIDFIFFRILVRKMVANHKILELVCIVTPSKGKPPNVSVASFFVPV